MSAKDIPESIREVAKAIALLPFLGEDSGFDLEAAQAALRNALSANGGSPMGSGKVLQKVFIELGIDKEIEPPAPAEGEEGGDGEEGGEEEGEEGDGGEAEEEAAAEEEAEAGVEGEEGEEGEEEAEPAAPPPPKEYTNQAADLFRLFAHAAEEPALTAAAADGAAEEEGKEEEDAGPSTDLCKLLATVHLCQRGYGEASVKFAVACYDLLGKGAVDESGLFSALTLTTLKPFERMQLEHLRRLWRTSDKFVLGASGEDEEEAEEEEEGAEKPPKEEDDGVPRISMESFFERLAEDEFVSAPLFAEVAVPSKDPDEDEEEEEEEED